MSLTLICGATGNVGGAVARALARQGHPARALVRPDTDARALTDLGLNVVRGDLRDRASVEAALRGVSTVICAVTALTRHMRGEGRLRIRDVDLAGATSLIDAAEAGGVERFVFISASRRFHSARCAMTHAVLAAESRLSRSPMRVVVVRSEPYADLWFSPDVGFEPIVGRVRIYGNGNNRICFTSTEDVGDAVAALALAQDPPAVVELGGPEAISIMEAVELAELITGQSSKRQRIPRVALRVVSRALGGIRPELASAMAFGLALDTSTSDVGAEGFAQLGIRPRSASDSLRNLLAATARLAAMTVEVGQNR